MVKKFAELTGIQERHIQTIGEPVYCSIVDQNINPWTCLKNQGQDECFGCSAPSHFCEMCHVKPLAFPEIELCDKCLHLELEKEIRRGKGDIPQLPEDTLIDCHLAGRKISQSACKKMQGNSCIPCLSPALLCLTCKKRPVRYAQYGLCLSCTVKSFAPDWRYDPKVESADAEVESVSESPQPQPEKGGVETLKSVDALGTNQNKETLAVEQKEVMCANCHQEPVYNKKGQLCRKCYQRAWKAGKTQRIIEDIRLIEQAKGLLCHQGKVSIFFLQKGLDVSYEKARQVMIVLEKLGIVGPSNGPSAREVLARSGQELALICPVKEEQNAIAPLPSTLTTESIEEMTTAQKIQFVEQFCSVMGNGPFPLLLLSLTKDLREWEKAKTLLKQIKL